VSRRRSKPGPLGPIALGAIPALFVIGFLHRIPAPLVATGAIAAGMAGILIAFWVQYRIDIFHTQYRARVRRKAAPRRRAAGRGLQ
jgi:hypothetical protein